MAPFPVAPGEIRVLRRPLVALSGDAIEVVGRDLDAKVFLELEETCHVERLRIDLHFVVRCLGADERHA